ncbi:MAG: nucleotidyltransferase domain-containing protein [archaeon]|nr:MAG: nucleotidyltransferase domain-containing protein [archaeon]
MKKKTRKLPKAPKLPTLKLKDDYDISYDFATKVYEKFGRIIKSIILFGSITKKKNVKGSDIDIIVLVDDCSVQWDQELVAWYREELSKIIRLNPYSKNLHVNTVRLSTWWQELLRGEPVVINVIRYGQALIDFGGFFNPLKVLLAQGKIKSTPEAIYVMLQRAPTHLLRTKSALLNSLEGMYWAMVDSSHAALIAAKRLPPSTEHIGDSLKQAFVSSKLLDPKYITWYEQLYKLAHDILHGKTTDIKAKDIDVWQVRTDKFLQEMAKIVNKIV